MASSFDYSKSGLTDPYPYTQSTIQRMLNAAEQRIANLERRVAALSGEEMQTSTLSPSTKELEIYNAIFGSRFVASSVFNVSDVATDVEDISDFAFDAKDNSVKIFMKLSPLEGATRTFKTDSGLQLSSGIYSPLDISGIQVLVNSAGSESNGINVGEAFIRQTGISIKFNKYVELANSTFTVWSKGKSEELGSGTSLFLVSSDAKEIVPVETDAAYVSGTVNIRSD